MDRERLARLLGMLGSAHDGEVVNAGRLAVRLLKSAGLTWEQALNLDTSDLAVRTAQKLWAENNHLRADNEILLDEVRRLRARSLETPASWRKPQSGAEQIEQAIEWTAFLSDWEREFVTSIAGRWRLTEKQQARLDRCLAIGRQ